MTITISCADTAKLVRKALKEAFPDVKFSVRSSTYSGGASISVRWTDGPNDVQVSAVTGTFSGSYFDGSIDYKGSTYSMMDGKRVHFGADSVSTRRNYSRTACERAMSRVGRRYGAEMLEGVRISGSEDWGYSICVSEYDKQRLFGDELYKHSDRLKVQQSKTAGKVIYLGNDGYSPVGALSV
jgi:hypothetical protein